MMFCWIFEILVGFQSILQGFQKILVGFREIFDEFQEILEGFQEILVGFQEILVGFQEILEGFQEILGALGAFGAQAVSKTPSLFQGRSLFDDFGGQRVLKLLPKWT